MTINLEKSFFKRVLVCTTLGIFLLSASITAAGMVFNAYCSVCKRLLKKMKALDSAVYLFMFTLISDLLIASIFGLDQIKEVLTKHDRKQQFYKVLNLLLSII